MLLRKETGLKAMGEIVRANETRFKAGDIGRLELSQSRIEADRFLADVVSARADGIAAELTLSSFLGRPYADAFPGGHWTAHGRTSQRRKAWSP